jgi:hypothetical protein
MNKKMHEATTQDNENQSNQSFSLSSAVYKRLNWTFVVGFLLIAGNTQF